MDSTIKDLLQNKENQYVLVDSDQTLLDCLLVFKKEKAKRSWSLLIPAKGKKYYVATFAEIQELAFGESRDILQTPISKFKDSFHLAKSIEDPKNIDAIRSYFKNNEVEYVVVTVMKVPVGLVKRASEKGSKKGSEKVGPENLSVPIRMRFQEIWEQLKNRYYILRDNTLVKVILGIVMVVIPTLFAYVEFWPKIHPDVGLMTGEWNVAVAGFTVIGDEKIDREEADLISSVFFNRLQVDLASFQAETDIIVDVWGPETIKPIVGDTRDERDQEAELRANNINADVIIYGTVEREGNTITIQPEFFVSIQNFYEAEEMVGQHSLGGTITITDANDKITSQVAVNKDLSRRSQLLSLITKGLSYYFVHDYEEALSFFSEANIDEYWQLLSGRELVYLFEGNAAGKVFDLEKAKNAYEESIRIEPEYSRGYGGLASIYYLKALESATPDDFFPEEEYLNLALDYYQKALTAEIQPESADIPTKVAFGVAQIYLTRWYMGEDKLAQAIENFQQVIDNYGGGENPRIQELASEAYGRLGLIDRQIGDNQGAIGYFELAVDISTNPSRRGLYWATLADLYETENQYESSASANEKSIDEYKNALMLSTNPELRAEYYIAIADRYDKLGEISLSISNIELALDELSPDQEIYQDYLEKLKDMQNQQ